MSSFRKAFHRQSERPDELVWKWNAVSVGDREADGHRWGESEQPNEENQGAVWKWVC